MHAIRWTLPVLALLVVRTGQLPADSNPPRFVDAERRLQARFGPDLTSRSQCEISAALVSMAEELPVGGAIHLPGSVPCGLLDFRRVADDVQITGGHGGTIVLGGGQQGIQLLFSRLDQRYEAGLQRPAERVRPVLLAARDVRDVHLFDPKAAPASDLFALFCEGAIHINHPVEHCAWIAGANAFGMRTVTASAPVNHSLFLWFGINWPFLDYNAHLEPKNRGRDWLDHAQLWFDCKGGGEGTRLYVMVETNYGNPGPGVVLQHCTGMALYHGSTERASSQGPGVYWLKECKGVKVGLRRVFCSVRTGTHAGKAGAAMPTHDITIEGGRANILHNCEFFGNAQEESAVNSDPEMQAWSNSFDFETRGFDGKDVLRFCFTPDLNRPEGKELEALQTKLAGRVKEKLGWLGLEVSDASRKRLEESFRSGRDGWYRLNAQHEITFQYGSDDLTHGVEKLANGHRLPQPPSVPATDAPRVRRQIEFTQQPDFGKALLAAGADPSGKRPSDDAFARVMFNLSRAEVESWLEKSYQADADIRAARKKKDQAGEKVAQGRLAAALKPLYPAGTQDPFRGARRPTLEIPAGTFLLTRPLVLVGGWSTVWGAGPDRTILKAAGDFKVIEQHHWGTLANFAVEGGKVGLAITGADHNDPISPTLHSYVAGSVYYRLAFRSQTFAGMHVGNDDPEMMAGAEHDQNRYVDLVFENTGQYGIYMNQNMLDKWLCLHGTFRGQKKAGIRIPFNNLIHGMIVGCTFRDIDGPGVDLMGGNPELRFRSHQVWIEQCDFTECGSAEEPAVDEGAGVCMAFTRCTITTRGKTIKAGYRGGAAIYEDVAIDVKTAEGAPAMLLRGARQNQTGRPNGHTLRHVKANGAVGFLNDANDYNDLFRTICRVKGVDPHLNWDCNPAAHELAPPNGWVHPFVFYHCDFGGKKYTYSLLNVDPDRGKVVKEIDLSPLAR